MDALLFLQARYKIVQICNCIYRNKWWDLCHLWEQLDLELEKIIPSSNKIYDVLVECRNCRASGNFMHFHDLLFYKIDFFLAQELCSRTLEERKLLSEKAFVENKQAIENHHKDVSNLLYANNEFSRIECSYVGTENVSISIKEGDRVFRLFSSINPWLECSSILNAREMDKGCPDEVYVLGFGGGHAVEELERRYPKAQIKVYLPNKDIFQVVMYNLPRKNILINQRLELIYDPMAIGFLEVLEKNLCKNTFYIDRQELRTCFRSAVEAESVIIKYKNKLRANNAQDYIYESKTLMTGNVGKSIHKHINKF